MLTPEKNDRSLSSQTPLVVDMTVGNPVLAQVPDTLLLIEAREHGHATEFIQKELKPGDLKPGTTNIRRLDDCRKWWVFGVFL